MHDTHLIQELIATVEKEAAARGAKRVTLVKLKHNPLLSHGADQVRFCFEVVKKGRNLVKNAALAISSAPSLARCQICQHEFEVDELPNVCPRCGSLQLQPVDPTGVRLEGYEIEP